MAKRILIVDDEEDLLTTLSDRLKQAGCEVLTARNGNEALWIARRSPPDLAVIDVMMPGMDGTQLGQTFRQERATASMPIIFLTALQKKTEEQEETPYARDLILSKPFEAKKLLDCIRKILGPL